MAIKKIFEDVIELLEANKQKKVSSILAEVIDLATAKRRTGVVTYHKEGDTVVAAHCAYYNQWFLVEEVEFGEKKSAASGLNPMCKEGLSKWTKQQRVARIDKDKLLQSVIEGDTDAKDLKKLLAKIEDARVEVSVMVIEDEDGKEEEVDLGYETLEALLEDDDD